jgi:hypothetical protein
MTELLAIAIALLAVVAILAPSSRAALTRREPCLDAYDSMGGCGCTHG